MYVILKISGTRMALTESFSRYLGRCKNMTAANVDIKKEQEVVFFFFKC